ncbi:MAG: hypothetical protein AB7K68_11410 [Bacteriovoracia bacterium]
MKTCMFFLFLLIAMPLAEAKPKKNSAKPDPRQMSEIELRNTAESELRSVDLPKEKAAPLQTPSYDSGLVSTSEILREDEKEPLPASEMDLGAQAFRPVGTGRVSSGETYSFDGLSAKPMILLGGRHWLYQGLRTSVPARVGLGLQVGVSSSTLRIQTNRGFVYDNVRLNSFLAMVGPDAEYFLDRRRRLAVGARVAAGRMLLSQSAPNSSITQSRSVGAWEAGGHLRYQPTRSFFVNAAYARRATIGAGQGLGIQQNNYEALIGFGM